MEPLRCSGTCALSGLPIQLAFQDAVHSVTPSAEASGLYLAPGFIDLQVNGFAGVDYNRPRAPHEEIARSLRAQFATGVTRIYPTVITGAPEAMLACLRNLATAHESVPEGDAIAGFHVEGPHISPEDGPRGAHPRQWVRPPDLDEFYRWQDAARARIRIVALSPEWPEAPRYIERVAAEGVVASIGHTRASLEQIGAAVDAGATMSTHLGKGAHSVLPKTFNYVWDQLAEDRLTASFIVDGIHIPQPFLTCAIRIKGANRSVLVTDAVMPAMCKPGLYKLGEAPVELLPDNRVVLRGETSELLISWNLGRPKFVDQPEIRAGKDSFRGGEFLTQVTNRGVVGRLRQMMQ